MNDCLKVLEYVTSAEGGAAHVFDNTRVVIGGDSAGATLTLVTTLHAKLNNPEVFANIKGNVSAALVWCQCVDVPVDVDGRLMGGCSGDIRLLRLCVSTTFL